MAEDTAKKSTQPSPASSSDVEQNKVLALLSYIGILWIIPLLAAKDSPFAMYHANQGLVLFLLAIAINAVGSILPIIGWFIVIPVGNLLVFVLAIMGIINAASGQKKPLPLIGQYQLIK